MAEVDQKFTLSFKKKSFQFVLVDCTFIPLDILNEYVLKYIFDILLSKNSFCKI